jgi:hypothetical protein
MNKKQFQRRRFQKKPNYESMPSFSKIDPDWLKIKLHVQHVGVPEHFIKQELVTTLYPLINEFMNSSI